MTERRLSIDKNGNVKGEFPFTKIGLTEEAAKKIQAATQKDAPIMGFQAVFYTHKEVADKAIALNKKIEEYKELIKAITDASNDATLKALIEKMLNNVQADLMELYRQIPAIKSPPVVIREPSSPTYPHPSHWPAQPYTPYFLKDDGLPSDWFKVTCNTQD